VRRFIVFVLIIFSSLTKAKAQRLSSDNSDSIPQDQLSMVLPPDTSLVARVDSLSPIVLFPWIDIEEGWQCGQGIFPVICCSYTITLTIVVQEVSQPKTECALGLIAADAPVPVKNPDFKNSAHAAQHLEQLVTLLN